VFFYSLGNFVFDNLFHYYSILKSRTLD